MADDARKLPVKSGGELAPPRAVSQFDLLRADIDRVFENFGARGRLARPRFAWPDWGSNIEMFAAPAIDVVEKDKAFEITAELPGVDEKEITLTVSNGVLSIKGEKNEEKEEKRQDYYMSERRFGSFERAVRLPEGADAEKIDAAYKNGVLKITVPKTAAAQQPQKTIPIKAS